MCFFLYEINKMNAFLERRYWWFNRNPPRAWWSRVFALCSPMIPLEWQDQASDVTLWVLVRPFNRVVCGSVENMAYHIPNSSKQDHRAVIQFLRPEDSQPAQIHRRMQAMYGNACVSKTTVKDWCRQFGQGRPTADWPRSGPTSDATTAGKQQYDKTDVRPSWAGTDGRRFQSNAKVKQAVSDILKQ
jgi:hypothetical protein